MLLSYLKNKPFWLRKLSLPVKVNIYFFFELPTIPIKFCHLNSFGETCTGFPKIEISLLTYLINKPFWLQKLFLPVKLNSIYIFSLNYPQFLLNSVISILLERHFHFNHKIIISDLLCKYKYYFIASWYEIKRLK